MKVRKRYIVLLALAFIICIIAFEKTKILVAGFKYLSAKQNQKHISAPYRQDFDMKKELHDIAEKQMQQPAYSLYNSINIAFIKKDIAESKPGIEQNYLKGELAFQYLASGYPDSAIALILELNASPSLDKRLSFYMHELSNNLIGSCYNNSYFYQSFGHPYRQIGLCYIRMGELQNCLACHNAQMCILPISGTGIYHRRQPTEMAIKYLTEDLKLCGNDAITEWLLNIAYSTLGQYPDSVPKEYFINIRKYDSNYHGVTFNDVAINVGLDARGLYGGTDMEDFDNDGFLDIFTTSGDLKTNVWLYHNQPDSGTFKNIAGAAQLNGIVGGANTIHADYNNDGFTDIYVMRGGWLNGGLGNQPNSLLRNNGDGTFTDVTSQAGLLNYMPSHTAAWADFDIDGNLDLFVGHENAPSVLYRNNGNGTFTDVSKETGIVVNDLVKAAVWGDVNNDGLEDLYVSCYQSPNHLFINQGRGANGKFTYKDVTAQAGVAGPIKSFSCFMADFNNDGWQDIVCFSYYMDMGLTAKQYKGEHPDFEPSKIYINNKNGTFTPLKSKNLDRSIAAMGLNFGDIDNDGWLDFYVGTGFPEFEGLTPNLMFRNAEGKDIEDVTASTGLGHLQKGHAIAFGDIDHDGDLDIYINIGGVFESDRFTHALFLNSGNSNNWVSLKLQGTESNRSAIGTKIEARVKNNGKARYIYRWVNTGGSYGANPLEQFIGLGKTEVIDELIVTWPKTGKVQRFTSLAVNKAYKITEGSSNITLLPYTKVNLKQGGKMPMPCCAPMAQ